MPIPLVSVLIPCFNSAPYIGETLECLLSQSWKNLEIVVVDDGSADSSVSEIRRFDSERLTLIERPNMGAAASRNLAFAHCKGDYIQWLDADDLISISKIEAQVNLLSGHTDCIASVQWGRFYGDVKNVSIDDSVARHDMASIDWLLSPASSMKFPGIWLSPREIVERAGPWNERLTLADDHEYFTRLILAANKVLFASGETAFYRSGIHGSLSGRRSAKSWQSAYEAGVLHQHHLLAAEDSPRSRRQLAEGWLAFAKSVYPYDPFLGEASITTASWLDPLAPFPSDGGVAFRILARFFGWRLARRLQVATGRG